MEYCCHVWAGGPRCYLELLDKQQKQIMQDCWSSTCCLSWNLLSSTNCCQLKASCLLLFIKFLLFHKMIALQKLWKMLFILSKKFFSFKIFKFCSFFPFLSLLSRFKRTHGSGIIYDAMNWVAKTCRCNFWNNSKTALYLQTWSDNI